MNLSELRLGLKKNLPTLRLHNPASGSGNPCYAYFVAYDSMIFVFFIHHHTPLALPSQEKTTSHMLGKKDRRNVGMKARFLAA